MLSGCVAVVSRMSPDRKPSTGISRTTITACVYTHFEALVCSNRRRAFVRTFDGPPNLLTLTFHWNTATRHLHYPTNT